MVGEDAMISMQSVMQSVLTNTKRLPLVSGTDWPDRLSNVPSPSFWPPRQHSFYEVVFVFEGTCAIVLDDQAYRISAGDLCIVPIGNRHYETPISANDAYQCYWFRVHSHELRLHSTEFAKSHVRTGGHTSLKLCKDMENAFNTVVRDCLHRNPHSELALRSFIALVANLVYSKLFRFSETTRLVNDNYSHDATIHQLRNYINAHMSDPEFSLSDMARQVALNPKYLCGYFKKRTGYTPYQYLIHCRLERAKQLLLEKDWSVERIATEVGYTSAHHFSTLFKRTHGVTPSAFRHL